MGEEKEKEKQDATEEKPKSQTTEENKKTEDKKEETAGKEVEEKKPNEDGANVEESPEEPKESKKNLSLEERLDRLEERERSASFREAALEAGLSPKYVKFARGQAKYDSENQVKNPKKLFADLRKEYPEFFAESTEKEKKEVPKTDNSQTPIDKGQHIFSKEEIEKMSTEEYKKNRDEIHRQESKGLIK